MKVTELSGGVGGARLARGLAALDGVDLSLVVNVADDERIHGLHISPDLDTVIYTLAGVEGPEGWGRAGDSFAVNEELARFGVDNSFRLGDRDLALNLFRSHRIDQGDSLSEVTRRIAEGFGVDATVLPATDDPVRTRILTEDGTWISFQEYFVFRHHRDRVKELAFDGAETAEPAPGVTEAIEGADLVIIGPSNPPLSIWPILAVEGVKKSVEAHPRVVAVSPLLGGEALKGPAAHVMDSLGLPEGNTGVAAAYQGLIDLLVIDQGDADDAEHITGLEVLATDIRIPDAATARRLAAEIVAA
ncbi:MAG TPA: 2-phospho-L-lactate transferase [Acidimicrobiia bacterium]|nr:2-phospho-L-lactate transferase [Acidimicrobiia bacterium]